MSGHSKWAQIKYRKGITDKRRGKEFSKIAGAISIAARSGSDPETNFSLRLAIEKAKQANMPKENIERAIKRGSGQLAGIKFEEVTYEGFGPGGVAYVIEAATDNKNRTTSEIRNIFTKFGARMSGAGSVAYLFKTVGIIRIKTPINKDEIQLQLIDAGADDFDEQEKELIIYSSSKDMHEIHQFLTNQNIEILHQEIIKEAKDNIVINNEQQAKKLLDLAEALETTEGVIAVHSNFDIPDEIVRKITKGP